MTSLQSGFCDSLEVLFLVILGNPSFERQGDCLMNEARFVELDNFSKLDMVC